MDFSDWLKHNEHLSGWVQAVGVIASLLLAIAVAAMQQKKAHKQSKQQHEQTLDLMTRQHKSNVISALLALESIGNQALSVFLQFQHDLQLHSEGSALHPYDKATLDLLSDAISQLHILALGDDEALRQALNFKIAYKRCITCCESTYQNVQLTGQRSVTELAQLNQTLQSETNAFNQACTGLSAYVLQLMNEQSHPRPLSPV